MTVHLTTTHNGGTIAIMKPAKAMTVRLSAEQADQLETVASVDNVSVSDVVRAAIAEHIEARKKDAHFKDSLRSRIAREQQLLDEQHQAS